MKVAIFGCAGYIGSAVTAYFLKEGIQVVGVDSLLYAGQQQVIEKLAHPAFSFYRGCLGDISLLSTLPDVTVVINLAGYVGDVMLAKFPNEAFDTNVSKTKKNIEYYRNKTVKYIFASSCSVYGQTVTPATEDSAVLPLSEYASQKLKIEKWLKSVAPTAVILRFATVFGPSLRTRVDLIVNEIAYCTLKSKPVEIYGLSDWRPYVYVNDIGLVIHSILKHPSDPCGVINVGSDHNNYTKAKVLEVLKTPKELTSIIGQSTDGRNYRVSFSKLASITDTASTTLEVGAALLVDAIVSSDTMLSKNE